MGIEWCIVGLDILTDDSWFSSPFCPLSCNESIRRQLSGET